MDITKFPTDNLYKFLAIFGLVISIVSYFYPHVLMNELKILASDTRIDVNNLNQKLTLQTDWLKSLTELRDSVTNKNKDLILKLLAGEQAKLDAYWNESLQHQKQSILLTNKIDEFRFWVSSSMWATLVGFTLMFWGFFL